MNTTKRLFFELKHPHQRVGPAVIAGSREKFKVKELL